MLLLVASCPDLTPEMQTPAHQTPPQPRRPHPNLTTPASENQYQAARTNMKQQGPARNQREPRAEARREARKGNRLLEKRFAEISQNVPEIITTSISGLVVEYIVAIDVTRVRFPADAFWGLFRVLCDSLRARFWLHTRCHT